MVLISENMFISGSPIYYISKYLGLAPYKIIRVKTYLYDISLSVPYLIMSFLFAACLVFLSMYGAISDLNAVKKSANMISTKSMVMTFLEMFIIIFVVILGTCGTPLRLKIFWKILTLINQIDQILNVADSVTTRKKNIKILTVILLLIFSLIICYICVEETINVKRYIIFNLLYIIVFIFECQYMQIVQSIDRRIEKFNECLTLDNINNYAGQNNISTNITEFNFVKPMKDFHLHLNEFVNVKKSMNTISTFKNYSLERKSINNYISKLSDAHSKIYESVDLINDGFGFVALIIILSCLFHLVTTPYFLLLDLLSETSTTVAELILQFLWVIAHFIRLLIIIQPCHSTCQKASSTNALVSKLLCSDIEDSYKRQLHMFSLQLIHRQIEFSAYGLCTINRPLLSAIAGAITTYLVILLQFK